MPTYDDLIELANICARHSRCATNDTAAMVLSKMAQEYRAEAAKLDSSKSHEVAEPLRRS
jgi:hypothetical protein